MKPFMPRYRILPFIVILGGIFCSCERFGTLFKQKLDLTYVLSRTESQNHSLDITLLIDNVSKSRITLESPAQTEMLGLRNLQITNKNGKILQSKKSVRSDTIRLGGYQKKITFLKEEIETGNNEQVIVKYTVAPDYEDHGERYGYIGENVALLSGYNLFLVPAQESVIRKVKIKFDLPTDWEAISSWDNPQGHISLTNETDLVRSWVGLGRFSRRTKTIKGTDVTVYGHESWNADEIDSLSQHVFTIYTYAADIVGRTPGGTYNVVFVPREMTNRESIYVPTSNSGQMRSIDAYTPSDWRDFAEETLRHHISNDTFHLNLKDRDKWFLDGICIYFGIKSLEKLDHIDAMAIRYTITSMYDSYIASINPLLANTPDPPPYFPLASPPVSKTNWDTEPPNSTARRISAPLAAYMLDEHIQKRTNGKRTLFDLIRYAYANGNGKQVNLLGDLNKMTGLEFTDFFEKRILNQDYKTYPTYFPPGAMIMQPTKQLRQRDDTTFDTSHPQDLEILFTAKGEGFLENCGCAINQSGGVARRATIIDDLKSRSPNLLVLDLGNSFPRHITDDLSRYEAKTYFISMKLSGYDAMVPSVYELWEFNDDLLDRIERDINFPIISANVIDRRTGTLRFDPYCIKKTRNYTIGVIGVSPNTPEFYRDLWAFEHSSLGRYRFIDPIEAIAPHFEKIRSTVDFVVIAGEISPLLVRQIVKRFPAVDIILSTIPYTMIPLASTDPSKGYDFADRDGYIENTLIVYSNIHSYGVERLSLRIEAPNNIKNWAKLHRYLDESIKDDKDIRRLLDAFYLNIEKDSRYWSSYDRKFIWTVEEQDLFTGENKYVGIDACAPCHKQVVKQWELTKHAGAYRELIKNHRNYYPRCVLCHTTGFNYPTGFQISDPSFKLGSVQCEVCHGPGEKHLAWAGRTKEKRGANTYLRSVLEERYCTECHDKNNSPEFNFTTYWAQIKH